MRPLRPSPYTILVASCNPTGCNPIFCELPQPQAAAGSNFDCGWWCFRRKKDRKAMAEGAAAGKEARAQPSSVTANGATMQQVMVALS